MKFLHSALRVTSHENARRFYDDLLGFPRMKEGTLPANLAQRIFGVDRECGMILYDCDSGAALEVFVDIFSDHQEAESMPCKCIETSMTHVALEVDDRDALVEKAHEQGFPVTVIERDGTYDLVFIRDTDGNLFEIK